MNAEPRSNPVRCVDCLHATTWADDALCDTCRNVRWTRDITPYLQAKAKELRAKALR